jgi:flagellar biosynthesis protein FlhG
MVDAIRKQQVLVQLFPESKTAVAFEALARTIVQEPQTFQPKGAIQFFWKRLLEFGGK